MTEDFANSINESRIAAGKKPVPSAPEAIMKRLSPDKVSAMAVWLAHQDCKAEAALFEAGGGYFAQLNWARSAPLFATEKEGVMGAPVPENIRDGLKTLADFDRGDRPISGDGTMGAPDALQRVFGHLKSNDG